MTPAEAHALQDRITAARGWVMWLVTLPSAEHPGKAAASALVTNRTGRQQAGCDLVTDTIDELRAMLPPGLTRRGRTRFLPLDVVETWD